jgi:hypothetical protein
MELQNEEIFWLGCRKKEMGRWGFMFGSALGFIQAQGWREDTSQTVSQELKTDHGPGWKYNPLISISYLESIP